MKKIIALQGNANCGKTTTLRLLIKKLAVKNPCAKITYYYRYNGVKIKSVGNLEDFLGDNGDRVISFELSNGIKIGVITYGDPSKNQELKIYLDGLINKYFCDLIFCACHYDDDTKSWIEAYTTKFEIIYVNKEEDKEFFLEKNEKMADYLLSFI